MSGTPGRFRKLIVFLSIWFFLLASCSLKSKITSATSTPKPTLAPVVTPTAAAPRVLTVCLGKEPNTLYPFAGPNEAAQSVLAAIYDGPFDTISYDYQPVILKQMPSLANGDVQIKPISVTAGRAIIDADGSLTALAVGTRLRPSGCRADDCVITYDGVSPLKMDQMVVTFRMRSDVTWSDGTPVTADDSVYAYQLAADKSTPGSKFLMDRTQTYAAADPASTQWSGIPGYFDPSFMTNFWSPAPRQAWGQFSAAELPQVDVAQRAPLGWGPYMIQDWVPGDRITLVKNPYYFRASQGYPKFDQLVFRFISDPNAAISELTAGRCDILDPSVNLDSQIALLQQMQEAGTIKASFASGLAIEWLGLGIVPASYDDGRNSVNDRPDILADPRTRQAIALCLDRQKVADTVLFGKTAVPASFVPPDHPLYNASAASYKFDPDAGIALLEQAGWRDPDGNPATPRVAVTVKGVSAGTPLTLNYYSMPTVQRRQVAEILSESLGQCGIGVKVQYYAQNDLYAPGPVGPLFGRRFDLIEYAMSTAGVEPPCGWFAGNEIPNALNQWVGTNVSGYKSADYDAACRSARLALPGEQSYADAYGRVQAIFANDLPSIPLYFRLRAGASRADVCHFDLDPSANPMWNVEGFDAGAGCKQ